MESMHDLSDNDAANLIKLINRIAELADGLAGSGISAGHEIYKAARDAREILMWDNISRETMRKLTGTRETFQGHEVSEVTLGYMRNSQKINAIKEFRIESGLGLKEAKEWVEDYMTHKGWLR